MCPRALIVGATPEAVRVDVESKRQRKYFWLPPEKLVIFCIGRYETPTHDDLASLSLII